MTVSLDPQFLQASAAAKSMPNHNHSGEKGAS
jgi:hypothetical protein